MRRLALGALAALLVAGCDSGPQPGTLTVRMTGTQKARSVKFRLVGAQTGVSVPSGTDFAVIAEPLARDTSVVAVFAMVGDSLNGRIVAHLAVPDVHAAGSYLAQPIEVAAPYYSLLTATAFTLTVSKP